MLTILALAAILTVIFTAATFRQWRLSNRLSAFASGFLAILLALATLDIAIRFNTASPLDLIRQPVPSYWKSLLGIGEFL